MGAGAFRSLTQVRRSVLPRLLGRVWYVQRRALSCCTEQFMPASMPLVSFRDRRILFLQDNVRQLKLRPAFLPPIWRARSANGNRRLGRLEIASSLFFLPFSPGLRTPAQSGRERAARCYRRKPWTYFSVLMERRLRNHIETNDDMGRNGGVQKE